MDKEKEINNLLDKVRRIKKNELDLSSDEDLSVAIMNLVSIEEHFFFTGAKTGKPEYFDLLNQTRQIRKELLGRLIKEPEGEIWCISKHLLAASMRLMEVGAKLQNRGKKAEARDLFSKAFDLYSLFWGLNLKLIDQKEIKSVSEDQLNVRDNQKTGVLNKLGEIVKKLIDCCKE